MSYPQQTQEEVGEIMKKIENAEKARMGKYKKMVENAPRDNQ
jgi:hypothetical protein